MTNDRSQPSEVSGLSKIEAEDLLDRLEGTGYNPCQLLFVDGEGFKVRPNVAPDPEDSHPAENKVNQEGEPVRT
jgi:hypothetical protein